MRYLYLLIVLLWTFVGALPAMAETESSWLWQKSLRVETTGDFMYMPSAVAFDPVNERYYVVDTGNNRLVSFDQSGQLLKAFSADNSLLAPFDMVRLDDGKLWVVEKGRNSLTLIDVEAKKVEPNILYDEGRQVFPDRIAYGGGRLYLLDRSSGQVLRLNGDLSVEQRFDCDDCVDGFVDFAITDESVWALETLSKKVYHFRTDGSLVEAIQLKGQIDFPVSLAMESSTSLCRSARRYTRKNWSPLISPTETAINSPSGETSSS